MRCPICKKEVEDLKYRPFCSKRCADIDLGNWFNEKYCFAATETDEQDEAELQQLIEKKEEV